MTWDERGRLWVCETYDYPNELQPKGQGRDRIRICEDTDGDGRADKFTVFAEKLSIPTAIAFYRGGALVQEGGETIYLKDTSGDDVADLRKTLVTGWSMRDTHGEVSNFRYGLDNWYYAMQGYNDSRPVLTDGSQVTALPAGFLPLQGRRRRRERRRHRTRVPPLDEQQHLGPGDQRGRADLRLDGQRQPQRVHADSQPLLRSGSRLGSQPCSNGIADSNRLLSDHREGAAGRLARRLHGGGRARALHGPQLSAGLLEPHRLRHRADRAPGRRRS